MSAVSLMLRKKAEDTVIPLWVIEKDYALSYLLAAIASIPALGDTLILKGGTALKKAYYNDHRFSEDMDYSVMQQNRIPNFENAISEALERAEELLQDRGFFQVQSERLSLRDPHPSGQEAFTVRVQFPYHRRPLCRLKIEVTVDEPLLTSPVSRPVIHDFSETFAATVYVYSLAEIVAEKLRALLQSRARLQERGWGASRVCRDYYDLWQIFDREDFADTDLVGLTIQKCGVRGISLESPEEFFVPELISIANDEWEKQLNPFVSNPHDPDPVLEKVKAKVFQLWQV